MTFEDRQRVREAVDHAKRAGIEAARNLRYEPWDDEPARPPKVDKTEILRRLHAGERGKDIAAELGISQSRVSEIKLGRTRP